MTNPDQPESMDEGFASRGGARARADAMEIAALWLARLDSGTADVAAFERWRAEDPRHAVAFAKVAGAWRALGDTAPVAAVGSPSGLGRGRGSMGVSRRTAAAVLVGLGVSAGAVGLGGRVFARDRVATGTGERRSLDLTPSVRADLNTDTRLSWRAVGDGLKLWLERGEVALRVSRSDGGVVLHAGAFVGALSDGAFNARLRETMLELTVIDGAVAGRARASARPVRVDKGRRLLATSREIAAGPVSAATLEEIAAWPQGEIVFRDEPLAAAVAEYNRYLERKLVILDPEIGRLRIGGRFTSVDPTDFLEALQASLPVRARTTADAVVLSHAG
jgi:transmembrane sensor